MIFAMLPNPPARGLARRIYLAFLLVAVIPTAIAGAIGIYVSLHTLRSETLDHLQHEVAVRAQGVGRFFDQLAAELLYLADALSLEELREARQKTDPQAIDAATTRLERDYLTLAATYPHIYQIRYLAADGHEIVRVDKKDGRVFIVPRDQLQNKGERYYFGEAMARRPGEFYVSPLDLNVEHGRIELPERPVIRVATPVGAGPSAVNEGILIINLHADFLLDQIRQMKQMGGLSSLMDKLPQQMAAKASEADMTRAERDIRRKEGIIQSMTPLERRKPELIKATRKKRIAGGAGVHVQEVNRLLKEFEQMQDMMKKMKGGGLMKMMKKMGGMKGLGGGGMPKMPF